MSDIIFNEKNEVIDLKNKNKADFKSLAKNNQLSEKFIIENADFLDWNIISENQVFSVNMMHLFVKRIKWAKITSNQHLDADMQLIAKYKADFQKLFEKEKGSITEDFVRRNYQYFNTYLWKMVSSGVVLSEEFVREFRFLVDFSEINKKQKHLSQLFLAEFNHFNYAEVNDKMKNFVFNELTEAEILENVDKMNWGKLMQIQVFSEKFMLQIIEKIKGNIFDKHNENRNFWNYLSNYQNLSEDFIAKFEDKIHFEALCNNTAQKLSEKIIRKYPEKDYYWSRISEHYALSADFIEDFKHKIVWERLSCNKMECLTEEIILKYKDKWYSDWIWYCQVLSEPFIRDLIKNKTFSVNWAYISECQTPILSLKFFQDFADKIDWWKVNYLNHSSRIYGKNVYENFDDDFIEGLSGKAKWYYIVEHSPVSEEFLRKNHIEIDWNILFLNQFKRLSKEFKNEFKHKFSWQEGKNYYNMSSEFVREFADNVNWELLYAHKPSNRTHQVTREEAFLREFSPKNKASWAGVTFFQDLSEAFMTDFADKLDFKLVSQYQNLSENFMRLFEKKLNWKILFKKQKMTQKFIQEFKHKL